MVSCITNKRGKRKKVGHRDSNELFIQFIHKKVLQEVILS
jgi:hypothetical protein